MKRIDEELFLGEMNEMEAVRWKSPAKWIIAPHTGVPRVIVVSTPSAKDNLIDKMYKELKQK